jgi:hypothetical protein
LYVYHGTWAHLNGVLHKSLPSVCDCMCIPPFVARQMFCKHIPAAKNARKNWIIVRVCVCVCVSLSMYPLPLLGNKSVKTFTPQQRIMRGVDVYTVHVISKQNRDQFFPELLVPYIMTWCLKTGIVEPQQTSTDRQGLGKHIPAATNTQAIIELPFICKGEVNTPL